MFHVYTGDARRAIFAARTEAGRRGTTEIAPAHILLGILQQCEIAHLFSEARSVLEVIRGNLERDLRAGGEPLPDTVDLPLAYANKRILDYAAEESERMRHTTVDCEHLLLGIHRESRRQERGTLRLVTSPALLEARILEECGAGYETLRSRLTGVEAD